jgi:hypothetical protein
MALNAFNMYNAANGYFEMRFEDDVIQKVASPDRIYFAKLYYGSQDMIGKLRRLYRVYDTNGDSYNHFIFMLDDTLDAKKLTAAWVYQQPEPMKYALAYDIRGILEIYIVTDTPINEFKKEEKENAEANL